MIFYFPPSTGIQTEEAKVKKSLKDAAKKGDVDVCKIYAKELYRSKKAVSKIYASKAHINSIIMSMQQQMGKSCISKLIYKFKYLHIH